MKKLTMALLLGSLSCGAFAEGHYVPGVEGLKGPSAPPPGTYYVGYLLNVEVDSLKAPGTSTDIPVSNKGTVTALANRFVHMTNKKFLGADYGMEAIIPIVRKDLNFTAISYDQTKTGIGDIYLSPLVLGWHGDRWDGLFTAGYWFDSASSDELAEPGNGYGSTMLTVGGTAYLTQDKSVSASAMLRYEMHSGETVNASGVAYEPGDQATLEWGIGKKVTPVLELALVGYNQRQTSKDSGAGATTTNKYSKNAIGVEASYLSKTLGAFIEAAYYKEYDVAANTAPGAEGSTFRLNIVKPF
ncbi:MAG: transporter [Candidatus Sedimenticola sp. 1PA]